MLQVLEMLNILLLVVVVQVELPVVVAGGQVVCLMQPFLVE